MEACRTLALAAWLTGLTLAISPVAAQVKLPLIFGDHMVLQRDRPLTVWGWASPHERVTVSLLKQRKTAVADAQGNWKVTLDRENAGGPYQLIVSGTSTIRINDVMIGDVWICAGQSNMQFTLSKSLNAVEEIPAARYPAIRHFKVGNAEGLMPQPALAAGAWQTCEPKYAGGFSAVGYFFACEVTREVGVPVGLINISRGGTNIENWISREGFEGDKEFSKVVPQDAQAFVPEDDEALKKLINQQPSILFNAMVYPLIQFPVAGFLWYQGESNVARAFEYRKLLPLLIRDWRNCWGLGDIPFYYVQLPAFKGNGGDSNSGSRWAELRESQMQALHLPNTGMAVTIDLGEADDLHPRNKEAVGKRLAAIALGQVYHKKEFFSGPVFRRMIVDGDQARVDFAFADAGLRTPDGKPVYGMEVAGADGIFYPASARIDGNEVIISSGKVSKPVAVRYGWADDPGGCNLYNGHGLPAAPFRSDSWNTITIKAKYRAKSAGVSQ